MMTIVNCPHCATGHDMELTHIGENREMIECEGCAKFYVGVVMLQAVDMTRPLSGAIEWSLE